MAQKIEEQLSKEEKRQKRMLMLYFLASWFLQAAFHFLPGGSKLAEFMAATMENWQSEFLQLRVQKVYEGKSTGAQIQLQQAELKALRREVQELKTMIAQVYTAVKEQDQ